MAAKAKTKVEAGTPDNPKVTFKCPLCEKDKLLEDMRTVTRFNPVLIVCSDCNRTLR
jgi:hypothetical protein